MSKKQKRCSGLGTNICNECLYLVENIPEEDFNGLNDFESIDSIVCSLSKPPYPQFRSKNDNDKHV